MAGSTYFMAARTHTSFKIKEQNQFKFVSAILELKGFSKSKIQKMSKLHHKVSKTWRLKNSWVQLFLIKFEWETIMLKRSLNTLALFWTLFTSQWMSSVQNSTNIFLQNKNEKDFKFLIWLASSTFAFHHPPSTKAWWTMIRTW